MCGWFVLFSWVGSGVLWKDIERNNFSDSSCRPYDSLQHPFVYVSAVWVLVDFHL